MQIKNQNFFFYLIDDLIFASVNLENNCVANLQISKRMYSRHYFRNFKDFFKLDIFNDFHYCLVYFKFFYFWNFFFLLHWVRYKSVLKKFFYNFFYNKNFMFFFLNRRKVVAIKYIEDDYIKYDKKDIYYYYYMCNNDYLLTYNTIFIF